MMHNESLSNKIRVINEDFLDDVSSDDVQDKLASVDDSYKFLFKFHIMTSKDAEKFISSFRVCLDRQPEIKRWNFLSEINGYSLEDNYFENNPAPNNYKFCILLVDADFKRGGSTFRFFVNMANCLNNMLLKSYNIKVETVDHQIIVDSSKFLELLNNQKSKLEKSDTITIFKIMDIMDILIENYEVATTAAMLNLGIVDKIISNIRAFYGIFDGGMRAPEETILSRELVDLDGVSFSFSEFTNKGHRNEAAIKKRLLSLRPAELYPAMKRIYPDLSAALATPDSVAPNNPYTRDVGDRLRQKKLKFMHPRLEVIRHSFSPRDYITLSLAAYIGLDETSNLFLFPVFNVTFDVDNKEQLRNFFDAIERSTNGQWSVADDLYERIYRKLKTIY